MRTRLTRAPLPSHSPILESLVQGFENAASTVLRGQEPLERTPGITLQIGQNYFYLASPSFNTTVGPFLAELHRFNNGSSANDSGNDAVDKFAASVRNFLCLTVFPHPHDADCLFAPNERKGNVGLRTKPFLCLLDIAKEAQTLDALPESLKNSAQKLVQNFPLKPPKNPLLPGRNLEDDYTLPTAKFN